MFPTLFRKIDMPAYVRERITTADNDFLDVDIAGVSSSRAVILCHGLEGSSKSKYILGMAQIFNKNGWDAVAMNYRSCSGEPNKSVSFYHSGLTADLDQVIKTIGSRYTQLVLIGFSLGGNLVLKYVGERGSALPDKIKKAVAISVPCDLTSSAVELDKPHNFIYNKRFIKKLAAKVKAKKNIMPDKIDIEPLDKIKSLNDFDDCYTAPLSGFKDAHDYWSRCSSRQFLPGIKIPTLIINAHDDPFLGEGCFPWKEAAENDFLELEVPRYGGHVGFVSDSEIYWSEERTLQFVLDI